MFDVFRFNHQEEDWEVFASFHDFQSARICALDKACEDKLQDVEFLVRVPGEVGIVEGNWPSRLARPHYGVARDIDKSVKRVSAAADPR
jgi:hypothetical protein